MVLNVVSFGGLDDQSRSACASVATCLAVMQVPYEGLADSTYRPCPLLVNYV